MNDLLSLLLEAVERPAPDWWSTVERDLGAPFPWFGGKSRVADLVWDRFGEVVNYVEPFAGSLAVLLGRPHASVIETVNDIDGHLANFWRSIQAAPDAVAEAADWPVNEVDLHARHRYLTRLRGKLAGRLLADPTYCAPMIAGWWVWGLCAWIGSGWCSGRESRQMPDLSGIGGKPGKTGAGVHARGMRGGQLPRLGGSSGPNDKPITAYVHRGDMRSAGQLPSIGSMKNAAGTGGDGSRGINTTANRSRLPEVFAALSTRLRYARVTCGDFERILSPAVTWRHGTTGVFLDPPYPSDAGSTGGLYTSAAAEREVFDRAFRYAVDNGHDKRLRIAFCYYDGTAVDGHDVSTLFRGQGWDVVPWKARGGYGGQGGEGNENARRERIAFSPACLRAAQGEPVRVRRALLLEDGATCARLASALLVARGYDVTHRRSAKAARAACARAFALYVVDVGVPASESGGEGDGLAFVAWLLTREPRARVIVWSSADRSSQAAQLGAMFAAKDDGIAALDALLRR